MPGVKNLSLAQVFKARTLPPIPPEPKPTKEEIDAELQERTFVNFAPEKIRREMAEFFCYADRKHQSPDLFWHPFAPSGYAAYLKSDIWRRISKKIKAEAGNKCACCPNRATQVHHRCYRPRVMTGEDTSLLIALCAECHRTIDFDEQGKVREAHAKERTLAKMFDCETERLIARY
jgi:hypothetical protein